MSWKHGRPYWCKLPTIYHSFKDSLFLFLILSTILKIKQNTTKFSPFLLFNKTKKALFAYILKLCKSYHTQCSSIKANRFSKDFYYSMTIKEVVITRFITRLAHTAHILSMSFARSHLQQIPFVRPGYFIPT